MGYGIWVIIVEEVRDMLVKGVERMIVERRIVECEIVERRIVEKVYYQNHTRWTLATILVLDTNVLLHNQSILVSFLIWYEQIQNHIISMFVF